MWGINNIVNHTSPTQDIAFSDGESINAVRGPEGASFRLIVNGLGFIDFTDTGHQPGGPHYWQLVIDEHIYWYDGQGAIDLTVEADGEYIITGDGNQFTGQLHPFPEVSTADIVSFDWMMSNKYIPYQNIPDEPGKTTEQIKALGRQYFPYSPYSFELAMSVYDWTTADFTRIDFMRIFTYTGVHDHPLDMNNIANGIWTANWPPYTPQNADYMNSFMMVPANSLSQVQIQLNKKAPSLSINNNHESNIIMAALNSMPRTSCQAIPKLYSGQVAISNLGMDYFGSYFDELPANSDPSLPPLKIDLDEAIDTFMAIGKTITLKSFMSFTDTFEDAQHYSNGIVIIVSPPEGATTWKQSTYITPLSDGPDKTEYLFQPSTQFYIQNIEKVTVDNKPLVQFYLQVID